jgi:hypothetical protein
MQSTITRLALFQFLTVIYTIIGLGMILKIRYGSAPPDIFAAHLRDYGLLLMILPAVCLICASVSAHRPLVGTGDFGPILGSGIVLLGALLVVAFFGTLSAGKSHMVVYKDPSAQPPPAKKAK